MHVHSFPPAISDGCRVMVLGSMPGKASLRAEEYYAHPQNLFWSFMQQLFGVEKEAPYEKRVAQLLKSGVGLWDVLHSCVRESSLDADIVESSIIPNDFEGLLQEYPSVQWLCFNGAKAEQAFLRYVAPELSAVDSLVLRRLPSTSPANASIPLAKKIDAWRSLQEFMRCKEQ